METDSGKMLPSATTTQDGTETLDDGANASGGGGGGEDAASSEEPEAPVRPGAFRVYPSNRAPSPEIERGATATAIAIANQSPLDAESQPSVESDHVVVEAYAVEDPEDPPSAVVVDTCFGIERKRLLALVGTGTGAIAIVLGCVLGIFLPQSKGSNASQQQACGPLCGSNTALPYPNREVFGKSCERWNLESQEDLKTCEDIELYAAAAHGCGCPDVETPQDGCGMLCSDRSEFLPDPQLVVKDIKNQEFSCQDWQLKSLFDKDSQECVNYNAIGVLCGCASNEMHPDACGGICPTGEDFFHSHLHPIWNTACGTWDTFSRYLPIWYNNDDDETCEEYYSDVAHGCACPELSDVESECGTLCQQRRTCNPICQGGKSEVPDPDRVVRQETCQAWELHSRLEVHEVVCPFYNMAGAQCGCENEPSPDACGPLCGGASLPDPKKEVYGQTCESWDFMSTHLGPAYGDEPTENPIIKSCEEHFSAISYACGCNDIEPPTEGCGTLCGDGQAIPHPTKVVNARTCQDLELLSLFEKDTKQCTRYEIFGTLCGCPRSDVYEEDCFKLEHLQNETYYFGAGGSVYSVSFGDDGYFAQIQSNGDLFMIGLFNGFDNNTVAMYGGGAPCGLYGPRSGSVSIIEDILTPESNGPSKSPEITNVIEPSVCVYQAELKVPKLCDSDVLLDQSKVDSGEDI